MARIRTVRPYDVIVIGAGPSGSTCAETLARAGHRVLLLEKEQNPGACANCTGIIGEEAFRVFDVPRDLVVNSISRIHFSGPYRREVDFDARRTLAHVVRRHALDPALAIRAVDAGAELRTGFRVTGASRRADGIHVKGIEEFGGAADSPSTEHFLNKASPTADGSADVEVRAGDTVLFSGRAGRPVTLRARAVVLAVGYNLSLLRAFGLEGQVEFVQGVQLLCRNRGVEGVEVFVGSRYAPGSFGWAVPLEAGWVKVGLTTGQKALSHLDELVESDHLRDHIDLTDARLRASPIPVGSLKRCHDDRLLVVGEAAGQVKTTSNGGIYYSMLGARAAAGVLDEALRADDLGRDALAAYERRWRQLLEPELRVGRKLRSVFESMSDARLAALMWMAGVDGLIDLIRDRADFDWHRPLIDDLARHRLVRPFFGPILSEATDFPA